MSEITKTLYFCKLIWDPVAERWKFDDCIYRNGLLCGCTNECMHKKRVVGKDAEFIYNNQRQIRNFIENIEDDRKTFKRIPGAEQLEIDIKKLLYNGLTR